MAEDRNPEAGLRAAGHGAVGIELLQPRRVAARRARLALSAAGRLRRQLLGGVAAAARCD